LADVEADFSLLLGLRHEAWHLGLEEVLKRIVIFLALLERHLSPLDELSTITRD